MSNDVIKTINEGDVLFVKGEAINQLYLIRSGEIGLFWEKEKHLVPYKRVSAKEFIGEEELFSHKAWPWTAIVLSGEVQYVPFTKKEVQAALKECPDWVSSLLKVLCERFADTADIIQEHNIIDEYSDQLFEIDEKHENFYKRKVLEYRQEKGA